MESKLPRPGFFQALFLYFLASNAVNLGELFICLFFIRSSNELYFVKKLCKRRDTIDCMANIERQMVAFATEDDFFVSRFLCKR